MHEFREFLEMFPPVEKRVISYIESYKVTSVLGFAQTLMIIPAAVANAPMDPVRSRVVVVPEEANLQSGSWRHMVATPL